MVNTIRRAPVTTNAFLRDQLEIFSSYLLAISSNQWPFKIDPRSQLWSLILSPFSRSRDSDSLSQGIPAPGALIPDPRGSLLPGLWFLIPGDPCSRGSDSWSQGIPAPETLIPDPRKSLLRGSEPWSQEISAPGLWTLIPKLWSLIPDPSALIPDPRGSLFPGFWFLIPGNLCSGALNPHPKALIPDPKTLIPYTRGSLLPGFWCLIPVL